MLFRVSKVERLRRLGRAFVNVLPFSTLLFIGLEWNGIPGQPERDSVAYFTASRSAGPGSDLYGDQPSRGPHEFSGEWLYLYPPPLAALLSFTPDVSYRTFDRFWLLVNMLSMWLFGASLARLRLGHWSVRGTLNWTAVVFLMPGSLLAVHFGNLSPVIWALVGLGLALPRLTGAALTVAAAFKITPVWALITLLIRRPRKHLGSAVASGALLTLISLKVFGLENLIRLCIRWFTDVAPALSQGQFWGGSLAILKGGIGPLEILGNLSLSFLPVQVAVLSGWGYDGGTLPPMIRLYLLLAGVGGPLVLLWLLRRHSPQLQATLILAAALFLSPITRVFSLPLLLLPLALRMRDRSRTLPASTAEEEGIRPSEELR
ncbi:MAG: DUF2029 domain-containing protein [Gemmatimonadetes bacterium]|nr:DUF2029 domain-containing protein [Gemmatimonadota bacterium]NNM07450.1 DUF2029 domain-containing protein [Gemmatimonadota bacterium]